ncbi:MAG: hypothetical protein ACRDT2_15370, partial [Natronosporangium sp.]
SFGSSGTSLPSGQPLGHRGVPGWGFPAGSQAGVTTVAGDGTVLVAAAGAGSTIGEYQPGTGEFATLPLPAPVADLSPIGGGEAVVFTADPAAAGGAPVLGILTKLDGRWRVAGGEGWTNQWTGGQLRASAPPVSEQACPIAPNGTGDSDCRGLGEVIGLPYSGHLIVAQAGSPGWYNGSLLALRLTGPEPDGRFTVTVTGHYLYPNIRDPQTGDFLDLAFRDLSADPTGGPDGERFVVGLQDLGDRDTDRPLVIQELRYDPATGTIAPVSAPTIPGDRFGEDGPWFGFSAAAYDLDGNLWAARHRGLAGGSLALYRPGDDHAPLGRPDCRYDPAVPLEDYRTGAGDQTVWGQGCRPDYDLLQAGELVMLGSLLPDPGGGALVGLSLTGSLLPVRHSGRGEDLTFEIGNLVDTGLGLLPAATGASLHHPPGGFDATGRLWLPVAQAQPGEPAPDQWLYAVAVPELFDPVPVLLPGVPGQTATVQAGHTVTTGTDSVPGSWATIDVISRAYVRTCTEGTNSAGCSFDGLPGDGFMLADRTGFGHLAGEVGYRVEVPSAGRYRIAYRVTTFEQTTGAEIVLTAGGGSYPTPVDTGGRWLTVPVTDPVPLPAGVATIRVSPPEGRGGWYLSWLTLQRA